MSNILLILFRSAQEPMHETARSVSEFIQSSFIWRGWGCLQYSNMEGDKRLEYIKQKVE